MSATTGLIKAFPYSTEQPCGARSQLFLSARLLIECAQLKTVDRGAGLLKCQQILVLFVAWVLRPRRQHLHLADDCGGHGRRPQARPCGPPPSAAAGLTAPAMPALVPPST